jgi:hypothetical protein
MKMKQRVPPKRRRTYTKLHSVTTEKTVFFAVTAVRTSNRTFAEPVLHISGTLI